MIKNWNEFLLLESKDNTDNFKDYKELLKTPYNHPFGITPNEISDLFYELDKNFILSSKYYRYLDNGRTFVEDSLRTNIKIDEELKPCLDLIIKIKQDSNKNQNDDILNTIKKIVKKIITINKLKSGIKFNNILIQDGWKLSEDEPDEPVDGYNPFKYKVDGDDPFNKIEFSGSGFVFKGDDEGDYVSSNEIRIILVSDTPVEITPLIFKDFYDLTEVDKIDDKGNLWCVYQFKEIADILFSGHWVERFFEPDDWNNVYDSYDDDYIIEDVIDNINGENKSKLIKFLNDNVDLDNINPMLDEEIESFHDISDDDLKSVFKLHDIDILNDIISRYVSVKSDKYYEAAEEYIKDETTEFLENILDISYRVVYNEKEYYDELWICFNPDIFIDYYSDDDEIENWEGNWGDKLYSSSVFDIIKDLIWENSNSINWYSHFGDNIYMYETDINMYIKDIFSEYGI